MSGEDHLPGRAKPIQGAESEARHQRRRRAGCRRVAAEPGPERDLALGRGTRSDRVAGDEIISDSSVDLGVDPGLVKDGVEAHLQELLAAQMHVLGEGWRLVRRARA